MEYTIISFVLTAPLPPPHRLGYGWMAREVPQLLHRDRVGLLTVRTVLTLMSGLLEAAVQHHRQQDKWYGQRVRQVSVSPTPRVPHGESYT